MGFWSLSVVMWQKPITQCMLGFMGIGEYMPSISTVILSTDKYLGKKFTKGSGGIPV